MLLTIKWEYEDYHLNLCCFYLYHPETLLPTEIEIRRQLFNHIQKTEVYTLALKQLLCHIQVNAAMYIPDVSVLV